MAGQVARRMFRTPLRTALLALALALTLGGFALAAPGVLPVPKPAPSAIPVKGTVTVVDLGAKTCIPCKMMAPILAELEREYKGRAAVVFIDVREDFDAAKRFGIRAIPTQIFYDKKGREVARHEGFMDKQSMTAKLNSLLAQ
ncbi:MAG: thioredoxin family protein [Humidesulfovibrio sp.]|uniref:thioredoxin family protein n=1 Tax=Humidesulfovibrio sp. TaxID=2910988 RepID=UPI0027FE98CD|nr:thioredoxin family protein [Humidesulfovibrio sp.]MDQ7836474.1 thioredoxin family protein [Humidesulfovibrio sp.]